jgi:UDPglucose 6-dehydrogenase
MLGLDKRVGRKFLTGAIGWGGPCFPRDTKAFFSFAESVGCQGKLAHAADEVNDQQSGRVINLVRRKIGEISGRKIAILGLTYKPNTDIVLDSDSVKIAAGLLREGARLSVYDPAGMNNAGKELGEDDIEYAGSAVDCLRDAELCILATPWDEFNKLQTEDFTMNMKQPVLLDCWRALRHLASGNGLEYRAIGLNTQKRRIRIKVNADDIRAAKSLSRAY